MRYKRIVVKIGSNVLTRPDRTLDISRMSILVDQLAELHRSGVELLVVSSGAVASGRSELPAKAAQKMDAVASRQLFSAVGQAKLINRYYDLFREHGIVCGQVLTTKESFGTRTHYLNQRNCLETMLDSGVVPIINENDTISVTELMFTDNDELSGLIASMTGADALVILSNVDGLYDGDPAHPESRVIREIVPGKRDVSEYVVASRSSFGRGGMATKSRIAGKVADQGIEVIIANGRRDDILTALTSGSPDVICTRFVASEHGPSSLKKWIAHSDGFAQGAIRINQGALEALRKPLATSLLPVGATAIEGDFEKDDIVRILGPDGSEIGIGRVAFDSSKARELVGAKGAKPLIHYDYLFLEN